MTVNIIPLLMTFLAIVGWVGAGCMYATDRWAKTMAVVVGLTFIHVVIKAVPLI